MFRLEFTAATQSFGIDPRLNLPCAILIIILRVVGLLLRKQKLVSQSKALLVVGILSYNKVDGNVFLLLKTHKTKQTFKVCALSDVYE